MTYALNYKELAVHLGLAPETVRKHWREYPHYFPAGGRTVKSARFDLNDVLNFLKAGEYMKKLASILLIIVLLATTIGCANTKNIDGVKYDTYGLLNQEEKRNPNIKYNLVVGNVVWSILLCETIVAPIYFLGFSIYEPVGKKDANAPKGSI